MIRDSSIKHCSPIKYFFVNWAQSAMSMQCNKSIEISEKIIRDWRKNGEGEGGIEGGWKIQAPKAGFISLLSNSFSLTQKPKTFDVQKCCF